MHWNPNGAKICADDRHVRGRTRKGSHGFTWTAATLWMAWTCLLATWSVTKVLKGWETPQVRACKHEGKRVLLLLKPPMENTMLHRLEKIRVQSIVDAFVQEGFGVDLVFWDADELDRQKAYRNVNLHPLVRLWSDTDGIKRRRQLMETCHDMALTILSDWHTISNTNELDAWLAVITREQPKTATVLVFDDTHHFHNKQSFDSYRSKFGTRSRDKVDEARIYKHASAILTPTLERANLLQAQFNPPCPIGVLPPDIISVTTLLDQPAALPERTQLLHLDGVDAENDPNLKWFLEECWEDFRERIPSIGLTILGSTRCPAKTAGITCIDSQDIKLEHIRQVRGIILSIVGGLNAHINTVRGMAHGLPVISTPIGVQDLLPDGDQPFNIGITVSKVNTCDDFKAKVSQLMDDDELWSNLSSNALQYARSILGGMRLESAIGGLAKWLESGMKLPGEVKKSRDMPQDHLFSHKLKVALHAQRIHDGKGDIMGSDITTRHLQDALLRSPDIAEVERFSKYHTKHLFQAFDLVVIEGWADDVPRFISIVRGLNPKVVILHWCLSAWNLNHVLQLEVNGFLTNSKSLLMKLSQLHPTLYLPLGAPIVAPNNNAVKPQYTHQVVYLGQPAFHKKSNLHAMLAEARPYGLTIYGSRDWASTEFREYYRGVLPPGDIQDLYQSVNIVLAVTVDSQKELGMINNRVYEALAAGAVVLTDHFSVLEETFGSSLLYHRQKGDTERILSHFRSTMSSKQMRLRAALVSLSHSYDERVKRLLQFLRSQYTI
mmetsp:Transcript_4554/g.28888  ORF Transcript_4554/g.28888 Transcript_4554/m.28888 type:complete len:778 (-) Transcript_4554:3223-5556(-)